MKSSSVQKHVWLWLLAVGFVLLAVSCTDKPILSCDTCSDTLSINCQRCNGNGTVDCPIEQCDDGVTGTDCNNCLGRGEIYVCSSCNGSDEQTCEYCGNAGLICSYCQKTSPYYPIRDYPPYYVTCEQCDGVGTVACEECKGNKTFPCSACCSEAYTQAIEDLEAAKRAAASLAERNRVEDEVLTVLSGITKNQMSYSAEPLTADTLQEAKDLMLAYEGNFLYKDRILKEIDLVLSYLDSKWEYVSGEPKMFEPTMIQNPEYYVVSEIKFDREDKQFYIRFKPVLDGKAFNGKIFYLTTSESHFMEYEWNDQHYKVFQKEDDVLLIEKHTNAQDTLEYYLEIKRLP